MTKQIAKTLRCVIAGQLPPPVHGQNLATERTFNYLRKCHDLQVDFLSLNFNKELGSIRKPSFRKLLELLKAIAALFQLRLQGKIDVLIYPNSGPHLVPLIRDFLLLPPVLLLSQRVYIIFHPGGMAEFLPTLNPLLRWLTPLLHRTVFGGIVFTEFGKRDPRSLGISNIVCIPHSIEDVFDEKKVQRRALPELPKLLSVGQLATVKGTDALIRAVAELRERGIHFELHLLGEPAPAHTWEDFQSIVKEHELQQTVIFHKKLIKNEKWELYAQSELFVFPSIAMESFGLVIIEAMMWELPVILTDWRANREILGPSPGGICFSFGNDLANGIATALSEAYAKREQWPIWGKQNRRRFLELYAGHRFEETLLAEL